MFAVWPTYINLIIDYWGPANLQTILQKVTMMDGKYNITNISSTLIAIIINKIFRVKWLNKLIKDKEKDPTALTSNYLVEIVNFLIN